MDFHSFYRVEPDHEPVAEEPKRRFRLHWFSTLVMAVCAVGLSYLVVSYPRNGTAIAAETLKFGVGGFIGVLAAGWIAFRVFGRSRLMGNLAQCVLAIGLTSGGYACLLKHDRVPKLERIPAVARDLFKSGGQKEAASPPASRHAAAAKSALAPTPQEDPKEFRDKLLAKIENATKTERGTNGRALAVLSGLGREVAEAEDQYARAVERSGILDMSGLTTVAQLDAASRSIDELLVMQKDYIKLVDGLPGRLREELAAIGIPRREIDAAAPAFERGLNAEQIRQITDLEGNMLTAMKESFGILRQNIGEWSVSDDGVVVFGTGISKTAAERDRTLGKGIREAAIEQQEIVQRRMATADALQGMQ